MNHKKDSNLSKETEKNMSALSQKWKCFRKHILSTDSSERKLIDMQQVHSSLVDDLNEIKHITVKCKTVRSQMNADVKELFNVLD